MSLLWKVPVTVKVVVEKRATVQLHRLTVVVDCFPGRVRSAGHLRLLKRRKEFVAVYPPFKVRIQDITSVLVDDRLEALRGPFQGVAQAVQGHIEVIAR